MFNLLNKINNQQVNAYECHSPNPWKGQGQLIVHSKWVYMKTDVKRVGLVYLLYPSCCLIGASIFCSHEMFRDDFLMTKWLPEFEFSYKVYQRFFFFWREIATRSSFMIGSSIEIKSVEVKLFSLLKSISCARKLDLCIIDTSTVQALQLQNSCVNKNILFLITGSPDIQNNKLKKN